MSTNEQALIELQTRVAFQEETIEALDNALRAQQLQIIDIENKMRRLRDELIAMQNSPDMMPAEQEPPPPHY